MTGEKVTRLGVTAAVPPRGEDHVGHGQRAQSPEDNPEQGFVEIESAREKKPSAASEENCGGGEGEALEKKPTEGAGGRLGEAGGTEVGNMAHRMDKAKVEEKRSQRMKDSEDGGGEEEFGAGGEPPWSALPDAPEDGDKEATGPEPSGGWHDGVDGAIEPGGGTGFDEEGKEVACGLRVEDERGDTDEAAAGNDLEGALESLQIFSVAKAEVDDSDGEKSEESNHRGGQPESKDGSGDNEVDGDGGDEGTP